MGRRKIAIEPITEERNRAVTFLKRKAGLFKKAHELSVLCSVEVAVVVFGSNRKLYQYCSTDMHNMLSRYGTFDQPHEHKGPEDFRKQKGAGGGEASDSEEVDGALNNPHMQHLPPHLRSRQPSGSPPVHGGPMYGQPGGRATPQPMDSRRPSNDGSRRGSSNLVPPQHQAPHGPGIPQQNGYYMTPQGVYNGPVAGPVPMGQPPMPYQYQGNGPAPLPQQPYLQGEQRRSSMPNTTFVRDPPPPPPPPPAAAVSQAPKEEMAQPPIIRKRPSIKPTTMFTPIAPSESVLQQHWNFAHSSESTSRSNSVDTGALARANKDTSSGPSTSAAQKEPLKLSTNVTQPPPAPIIGERTPSVGTAPTIPVPPPGKRPRLKVTIPSEQSDDGADTASTSPKTTTVVTSGPGKPESNHSVVLPPPSPSVGLLSAGHTGPVNPFARPPPTSGPGDTPMSALPSRFTEASLLNSPSNFFPPEWNMMPSPLNFQQTPVTSQPGGGVGSFKDVFTTKATPVNEDTGKRKSAGEEEGGQTKKVKT